MSFRSHDGVNPDKASFVGLSDVMMVQGGKQLSSVSLLGGRNKRSKYSGSLALFSHHLYFIETIIST